MYSDATKKHYIIKQEAERLRAAAQLFGALGCMNIACLWAFFLALLFVFGQSTWTLKFVQSILFRFTKLVLQAR
jgi:hypothetical protein